MKTSERIKKYLEDGYEVGVKAKDGEFVIFNQYIDTTFYSTDYFSSIEECKNRKKSVTLSIKEEIDEYLTNEITIIPPITRFLKPGEKCQIIEEARNDPEYEKWTYYKKQFVGKKVLSIKEFSDGKYYVLNDEDNVGYGCWLQKDYVAPYYEEEESPFASLSTEDLKEELKRRGEIVDGEVIKTK